MEFQLVAAAVGSILLVVAIVRTEEVAEVFDGEAKPVAPETIPNSSSRIASFDKTNIQQQNDTRLPLVLPLGICRHGSFLVSLVVDFCRQLRQPQERERTIRNTQRRVTIDVIFSEK